MIIRYCEERSDEAIQRASEAILDCFASLAMTAVGARAFSRHPGESRDLGPKKARRFSPRPRLSPG
jgi:hypothetical protein